MTTAAVQSVTTYWENNGLHQEMYQQVKGLIPDCGASNDEEIELLRRVVNAYYDIYNNGGINSSRFEGMSSIVDLANLDTMDAIVLKEMFKFAADGLIEILFEDQHPAEGDDDSDDDEYRGWLRQRQIYRESDFAQPLERLSDWAIRRAWFKHCA